MQAFFFYLNNFFMYEFIWIICVFLKYMLILSDGEKTFLEDTSVENTSFKKNMHYLLNYLNLILTGGFVSF